MKTYSSELLYCIVGIASGAILFIVSFQKEIFRQESLVLLAIVEGRPLIGG